MADKEVLFSIGTAVTCRNGDCGVLERVVVDPIARSVTYLVVGPKHRNALRRLVPIKLVEEAAKSIVLSCTTADFERLDEAEETQYLPGSDGLFGYGQEDMLSEPYFRLGMGGVGLAEAGIPQTVTYDRVPAGDVEVRRGDPVHATDGPIGRVQGLIVDADHHVTHVLLDEGHLWGKKEVAIPIRAVTGVHEVVELNLTKDEVRELPAVVIERP